MEHYAVHRSLFSTKPKEAPQSSTETSGQTVLGWKLFGKVPLKQAPDKNPTEISLEYKAKAHHKSVSSDLALPQVKRSEKEVPSTTALILEQRPV